MARLTSEMQSVMSKMSADPSASASSPEEIAKLGQELDDFTRKMEAEGIQPEDLLKAILGEEPGQKLTDDAKKEVDQRDSQPAGEPASKTKFEDTIRRTMERIGSSDTKATNATKESGSSEEDMLADLLKAMQSGAGGEGEDGELSKMFLGMMEQLTNKEMLYEPMKELDNKYPEWLDKNKSKLPAVDFARYTNQQKIVKEIVGKFEEKGYNDNDSKCREYIWERMQRMQAEGSPPEDLIANPFPGMGEIPDMGGGGEGDDVGCPTQ
jgi:peroxin-19